ncbi:hypothetical protein AB833_14905 [Chromatiales bacterium (ex Bugula neritina AB1)]|nr:hypothetical protein AB833_14905 [Chromatiales bacterium (ex Bugula neritina AB1)]
MPESIPFNLTDHLELVDWTGRQIRDNKSGAISDTIPPILERLSISPKHWVYLCTHFESKFKGLVGTAHSLTEKCSKFSRKRRPNLSSSKLLFN